MGQVEQVDSREYFPENTSQRILPREYFPENTSQRILPREYFPENTSIRNSLYFKGLVEAYGMVERTVRIGCWNAAQAVLWSSLLIALK